MFMDIVEATGSIITVGRLLPHHLFHRQFVVTRLLGVANRVPFHEVYGRRISAEPCSYKFSGREVKASYRGEKPVYS